jgi:hypothetical protein
MGVDIGNCSAVEQFAANANPVGFTSVTIINHASIYYTLCVTSAHGRTGAKTCS